MQVMNAKILYRVTGIVLSGMLLSACNTAGTGGTSTTEDTLGLGQQTSNVNKKNNTANDQSRNLRGFCPRTIIRDGTETYREFDPPAENGAKEVSFQSTISEVARECNYSGSNLNVRVGIRGRAINGPSGKTGNFVVPIRVAVVDAAKEVKYSTLHQVSVTLPPSSNTSAFSFIDSNINLPAPDKPNLIIYVGFDEGPPEGSETQAN